MPDSNTLYAVAAVISAAAPILVAAIIQAGKVMQSRRGRGDTRPESPDE